MRITNSMMVSQFLTDANAGLNRVADTQQQVNSTKRMSKVSDDPIAAIQAMKMRDKINMMELYQGNIDNANAWLSEGENATKSINKVLVRAYELVDQALNDSNGEDEYSAIAEEIKSLRDEIVNIGNTTFGTSYLFGGYNFTGSTNANTKKEAPFQIDETTGDLIYNGINMTVLSWQEDFEGLSADIKELVSGGSSDEESITELFAKIDGSLSVDSDGDGTPDAPSGSFVSSDDSYIMTTTNKISEKLDDVTAKIGSALFAAEKAGVPKDDPAYKALDAYRAQLETLGGDLSSELSKDMDQSVRQRFINTDSVTPGEATYVWKDVDTDLDGVSDAQILDPDYYASIGVDLLTSADLADTARYTLSDDGVYTAADGTELLPHLNGTTLFNGQLAVQLAGRVNEALAGSIAETGGAAGVTDLLGAFMETEGSLFAVIGGGASYDGDDAVAELATLAGAYAETAAGSPEREAAAVAIAEKAAELAATQDKALNLAKTLGVSETDAKYTDIADGYTAFTAVSDALTAALTANAGGFDETAFTAALGDAATGLAPAADTLKTALGGVTFSSAASLNTQSSADVLDALDTEATDVLTVRIGDAQTVEAVFNGVQLFGGGSENVYHIMNKLTSLLSLGAEADHDELSSYMTKLQGSQQRILSVQTTVGATINRLDMLSSRYDTTTLNYNTLRSTIEDADMAEAITNWTTAKTVYNAALSAGAKIMQTSLIDFIS